MIAEELIGSIHEHGPSWAARVPAVEQAGYVHPQTASELRALGVHRILQPREFGGAQGTIEDHLRVMAAVGEYCVASSWCAGVWGAHNWMMAMLSSAGQAEVWADPEMITSASIVPRTKFVADGGDVLVEGRFGFASGCDHAQWFGIGGLVDLGGAGPSPVICWVPRSEVRIDDDSWNVVALVGTGSKDIVIDERVRVPMERVLLMADVVGGIAPGQVEGDRALYRAPFRATGAIVLAASAVGAARAAAARFTERLDGHLLVATLASQRSDPAAGLRLAESTAEINAASLVLFDAGARLDSMGIQRAAGAEPSKLELASTQRDLAYAVRLCAAAVDRLFEASGGSALQRTEPLQQLWRDVHAIRLHAVLTWDGAATTYSSAVNG